MNTIEKNSSGKTSGKRLWRTDYEKAFPDEMGVETALIRSPTPSRINGLSLLDD